MKVIRDKEALWTAVFEATAASPALNVNVVMHVTEIDDDAPVGPALQQSADEIKSHPHEEWGLIHNALFLPRSTQEVPLEPVKPVNWKPHKIHIFFGVITYSDIFNQQHTTHYCIRLGQFCDIGNDGN